jgi:Tfp pilus assembly protein PilP
MQGKKIKQLTSATSVFLIIILSVALLDMISCSEKAQEAVPVPSMEKKVTSKIDDENSLKAQVKDQKKLVIKEVYTYNSNGKVDPFVPMVAETTVRDATSTKTESKKPVVEVPMTPLQKLDVDDFILVAVIATPTGFCALLEDPAMNGYKVREGMQIGRKSGVVKKILSNSVIIEENKELDNKNNEKKINTLNLRKK